MILIFLQKSASGLLAGLEGLENSTKKAAEQSSAANVSESSVGDEFDLFAEMIQTPQFHHPHHRAAFQVSLKNILIRYALRIEEIFSDMQLKKW